MLARWGLIHRAPQRACILLPRPQISSLEDNNGVPTLDAERKKLRSPSCVREKGAGRGNPEESRSLE